jgi:hypothetical protein
MPPASGFSPPDLRPAAQLHLRRAARHASTPTSSRRQSTPPSAPASTLLRPRSPRWSARRRSRRCTASALGGTLATSPAKRGPARPRRVTAHTAVPAPTRSRKASKRTPEDVGKMGEAVVAYVARNSGQFVEPIGKALGARSKELTVRAFAVSRPGICARPASGGGAVLREVEESRAWAELAISTTPTAPISGKCGSGETQSREVVDTSVDHGDCGADASATATTPSAAWRLPTSTSCLPTDRSGRYKRCLAFESLRLALGPTSVLHPPRLHYSS